jgi:hypothetical protein
VRVLAGLGGVVHSASTQMNKLVFIKSNSHAIRALRDVFIPDWAIVQIMGTCVEVNEHFEVNLLTPSGKKTTWSLPPDAVRLVENI